MPRDKKTNVLKAGAAILCAGLVYGYILIPLGLRIPCPVRYVTGLRCPGCGITDLCIALLHGRFREAPAYNWGAVCAVPCLLGLGIYRLRGGNRRAEGIFAAVLLVLLLGWGVFRNIYGL